jgi:hypothetical protein
VHIDADPRGRGGRETAQISDRELFCSSQGHAVYAVSINTFPFVRSLQESQQRSDPASLEASPPPPSYKKSST